MKKYWIGLILMCTAVSVHADWYQGKEKGVFDPFYYVGETVSSALDATYGRVMDTLGRPPARYVDTIPTAAPAPGIAPASPQQAQQQVYPAAQQIPQQYQSRATPASSGGQTMVFVDQGNGYGPCYGFGTYYGGYYGGYYGRYPYRPWSRVYRPGGRASWRQSPGWYR